MENLRVPVAAMVAVGITCGLFLLMYKLISMGSDQRTELDAISGIHFGPVEIPDEVIEKSRRKPPRPKPPGEPPPPPRLQVSRMDQAVQEIPDMDIPPIEIPLTSGAGMFIGNFEQVGKTAEGDVIPIVRINPIYPREAALKGQEGWVRIEFTITETGTVKSPEVIDAMPPRIFNREAIRAILKWKFKPRVVDGVAVERRAVQTIDFKLEGN